MKETVLQEVEVFIRLFDHKPCDVVKKVSSPEDKEAIALLLNGLRAYFEASNPLSTKAILVPTAFTMVECLRWTNFTRHFDQPEEHNVAVCSKLIDTLLAHGFIQKDDSSFFHFTEKFTSLFES